jgi:HD superfamily phosphohydrolase YqeK
MGKESILDDILNKEKDSISIEEEAFILKPLIKEIEMISDEGIRSFVRSILIRSNSFWEIPSSFSGKYHPSDEHNVGGNVLHTKRVVRAAKVISDSYSLTNDERDLVYAACLLHDITKGIKSKDDKNSFVYDPMHPYTVGRFVEKCQEHDKKYAGESQSSTLFTSEDTIQSILRLVRCHLGPWSPIPETVPITYLDVIVHISDNIASKLHYLVDGEDVIEERWKF